MNKFLAIILLLISTTTYGNGNAVWPNLTSFQFVSGRAATAEDVEAGYAVFVLQSDGQNVGSPLAIEIPQYAIHTDVDTGKKTKVVVVQAEQANGQNFIGARIISTNEFLVGFFYEFKLLGVAPTDE